MLALMLVITGAAQAQTDTRVWVQIEAQPTLAGAEDRARAYSTAFPDVVGFRMASGWYAIALGPYTRDGAEQRLATLRADNLIPSDSFVALGQVYRAPYWPAGTPPASEPLPVPEAPVSPIIEAPVVETPLVAVPTPEAPAAEAPVILSLALPDETAAEARRSEALLTAEERRDLQSALQSFGFYSSAIDGAFGPGTRAAMLAWQESKGYDPTGILTTAQRAALLGERARIEAELGLQTITENEAGITAALPMALVEFEGYEPPFVQYKAKDNSGIRLVLISAPGDRNTLYGLYDVLQTLDTVPPGGARDRGDRSFTIDAGNAGIASYSTAELSQGFVKGYMVIWEPRAEALARRAIGALQASFKSDGRRALDPGLVPLDDATRAGFLAGMEVRRPTLSRTGFYVTAEGAVLTTTDVLRNCTRLTLDRDVEADLTFRDDAMGVALLTPRTRLAPTDFAGFETASLRPGSEVAVAGYSYEDALPAPALTFGSLAALTGLEGEAGLRRLTLAALPGDAGGPVVDGSGAVLGMLLPADTDAARKLPEGVAFAAGADVLAARLGEAGVTVTPAARNGALAPEDLTNRASRMTVLVSCWN